MKTIKRLFLITLLGGLLLACGQKRPLQLPAEKPIPAPSVIDGESQHTGKMDR